MNEIVKRESSWLVPADMKEAFTIAECLSKASLVPDAFKGKPNDVMAAIMLGSSLGLTAMQSLLGISVIKGRPSVSSQLAAALILVAPVCKSLVCIESTPSSCTYQTHREGWKEPRTATYTIQEAERAQLTNGDNWRKFPADMLRNRCVTRLARTFYPDVIGGLNLPTTDELEDDLVEVTTAPAPAPPPGATITSVTPDAVFIRKAVEAATPAIDAAIAAEVVAAPPAAEPAQTRAGALGRSIVAATTEEQLKPLGKEIAVAYSAKEINDTEVKELFALVRGRTEDLKKGNA